MLASRHFPEREKAPACAEAFRIAGWVPPAVLTGDQGLGEALSADGEAVTVVVGPGTGTTIVVVGPGTGTTSVTVASVVAVAG